MNKINSYNELIVWQKSVELVTEVYKITASLPETGSYGLSTQMNKASVSIPCNIAEGWGRETTKSYSAFLRLSRGSVFELETLLQIGKNLKVIDDDQYIKAIAKTVEMQRMLNALIKKVKHNSFN